MLDLLIICYIIINYKEEVLNITSYTLLFFKFIERLF